MADQKTTEELRTEMIRLRKEVEELRLLIDAHLSRLNPATPERTIRPDDKNIPLKIHSTQL